jgi:alpha-1,3-rhamnosyl/mannosyltransferase
MLRAARIVAVSQNTAEDLVRVLGVDRSRVSVVPVPINPAFATQRDGPGCLAQHGITLPAGPKILSVGVTRRYKNLEFLLGCMARRELAGVSLIRVGRRLTERQQRLAARLGVTERIIELGNVRLDSLLSIYRSCEVLAQPSLYEGFGMPVAEAMASGLPVVCSTAGALPEVAAGAAQLVEIGGPDAQAARRRFAVALREVIDNPALRGRLISAGCVRARAFEPEVVARQLFGAYREALG